MFRLKMFTRFPWIFMGIGIKICEFRVGQNPRNSRFGGRFGLKLLYLPKIKQQTKTGFLMGKIVIAIDGYSGCGKSSTAKSVAKDLGFTYIDSGAMYRAATLHFLNNYLSPTNPADVAKGLKTLDISFHHNPRSEEHTSELQSRENLVCRLLLEKKKKKTTNQ